MGIKKVWLEFFQNTIFKILSMKVLEGNYIDGVSKLLRKVITRGLTFMSFSSNMILLYAQIWAVKKVIAVLSLTRNLTLTSKENMRRLFYYNLKGRIILKIKE